MGNYPEKYTTNTIIEYIAQKHKMPKKQAKQVLDDLFDVIEHGALAGARVPVGPFGKLFVKVKPPQPAREGRNPKTGDTIQISAKPETKVPKFSFVKTFKEKCKSAQ